MEMNFPPAITRIKTVLRSRIESVSDLLIEPEPPIRWLIENIWLDQAQGFIAGAPGAGKTWLALSMLIACASGQDFLGTFKVPRPGPCILVEEESSRLNLQRRIHALARGAGLGAKDLVDFRHITGAFVKFPADVEELIQITKGTGSRLIVFDSFRRFHDKNENSSHEMQPVLDALAMIKAETGASVVVIHHLRKESPSGSSGKTGVFERMRGTGDLWAWRDCVLGLEGTHDPAIAKCSFQFRDAEEASGFYLERKMTADGGIVLSTRELNDSPEFVGRLSAIEQAMSSGSPMSKNKVFACVKGKKTLFLKVFRYAETKNLVVPFGDEWVWRGPSPETTKGNQQGTSSQ